MPDRFAHETDRVLEERLEELGRHVAFPPTPDLAGTVRRRLDGAGAPRRPVTPARPARWRLLAVAALALVALGAGILLASPGARAALADRLGLRGVEVVHVPAVPSPPPTARPAAGTTPLAAPSATATPSPVVSRPPAAGQPLGAWLGLGQPVAGLAAARARVPFQVVAPTLPELGSPDAVYVGDGPSGPRISLVYGARPGLPPATETGVALLLTQFRGGVEPGVVYKSVGPETRVEETRVEEGAAFWIAGAPHLVMFRGPDGGIHEDRLRLAGNVLLWERGELTLRIEGAMSRDAALRVAASVR